MSKQWMINTIEQTLPLYNIYISNPINNIWKNLMIEEMIK